MNFFVFIKDKNGVDTLITPPLDGTVLPGVTRDSIIQLAKQWKIKVEERLITMFELCTCIEEKRVLEVFGAGVYKFNFNVINKIDCRDCFTG